MFNQKTKKKYIWNILGCLIIALFCFAIYFATQISFLSNLTDDLNKIEYLNSSTQRVVRLALSGNPDDKILYYLDTATNEHLSRTSHTRLSIIDDSLFAVITAEVHSSWNSIKDILESSSADTIDVNALTHFADNHFYKATDLSNSISALCEKVTKTILYVEIVLLSLIIILGAVVVNNILQTNAELKQSLALAQIASLDSATGLYNRSKCQELFKANYVAKNKQRPGVIVLDLNDLKLTNDQQGHRIGDELIHSFATLIKASCDVHITKPFIGRYGGDEFIVFYDDVIGASEIEVFLKELKFLSDDFNRRESRFQISYAVGYAVNEKNDPEFLNVRQLFDKADEAMYINKQYIKQQRRKTDTVSDIVDNKNLELSTLDT